jgi:LAS superfamily LD-carboxypeptidase LdcB
MPRAAAQVFEAFIAAARAAGIRVTVTSAYRSPTKQRKLYDRFLRGETPYTVAAPGTSLHEQGRAVDMVASPPAAQRALARVWERAGFTWGGRFRDPVHFDLRPRKRR